MDKVLVSSEYESHLTDTDLMVLASVTGRASGTGHARDAAARLRREPAVLLDLFDDPRVCEAVLGGGEAAAPVSPFCVFTVAVHQTAAELASLDYLPERTGTRQRVPLFDAPALRDFLAEPGRRLFLAELLASFTKVASGRYQVQAAGGQVRTRRYSELDPVRLAGLLDAVSGAERPGVYRRLGDVSLFLAGVFPDYAAAHLLGPVNVARLLRAARVAPPEAGRLAAAPALELLEHLGARWYRAAGELAQVKTARLTVVTEVADRFRQARRVLNHVADRYLFPQSFPWLPQPG